MTAHQSFTLRDEYGIGQARVAQIRVKQMTALMRDALSRMRSPIVEVAAAASETFAIAKAQRSFARAVLAIHGGRE